MYDDSRDRDRSYNHRGDEGGDERGRGGLGSRRRKVSPFYAELGGKISYLDPQALKYFVTERGKIVPRRISRLSAKHQRVVTRAVERARALGIMPYTSS